MSNLYKTVKRQETEIKSLKTVVSRLESELWLVRALLLAQKQQETVPFRKLGPYYDEPIKKFDDHDWWKNQPWMVVTQSPKTIQGVWVKNLRDVL